MAKHWSLERDAHDIGWLTFERQGAAANTLSRETLEELVETIAGLRARPPRGLVIRSGKESGFIAGADIEEFTRVGTPEDALAIVRRGWDAMNALAALPFPTLALIDGFCMGGGLELALACRYRIAVDRPGTRLSLPEVMLGIVPAWGGVRRLPRLIGPTAALDLMMTGRAVDARRAKRIGLVDAAVPPRVMENAARMMLEEAPPARKLPFMQRLLNGPLRFAVAAGARRRLATRARREHYPAPWVILDLWQRFDGDPLAPAPGNPASPAALGRGDTARNLVRLFFLQERMKSFGRHESFRPARVHVVGAGVMGGDIAAWCAMRGLTVTLQDQSAERLAPAMKRAGEMFRRRLREPARIRDAADRLIPDIGGDGAWHADVIIEAIFEDLSAKRALFARLEAMARPDALLATNTSSLKLADIAAALSTPSRLVGIHFFNPVAQMQLVEVVSAESTEDDTARRAAAFVRTIDKLPLPVKDAPGFLVNRVLGPYLAQALRMVDSGLPPETIDAAATAFGMPMGPIELADTVGLDICIAVGRELAGETEAPVRLKALVDAGHLGRKTGRGFYLWANGKPRKAGPGTVPHDLAERLIAPYLKEAQAVVAEGIVTDADLADAGLIFGTGFAPFRGGPLTYLKTRA